MCGENGSAKSLKLRALRPHGEPSASEDPKFAGSMLNHPEHSTLLKAATFVLKASFSESSVTRQLLVSLRARASPVAKLVRRLQLLLVGNSRATDRPSSNTPRNAPRLRCPFRPAQLILYGAQQNDSVSRRRRRFDHSSDRRRCRATSLAFLRLSLRRDGHHPCVRRFTVVNSPAQVAHPFVQNACNQVHNACESPLYDPPRPFATFRFARGFVSRIAVSKKYQDDRRTFLVSVCASPGAHFVHVVLRIRHRLQKRSPVPGLTFSGSSPAIFFGTGTIRFGIHNRLGAPNAAASAPVPSR